MHLLAARQDELDAGPQAEDLGQTPADLVMLSFSDSDLTALAAAWRAGRKHLPGLRLANLNRLGHPLSVDLYADTVVAKAKLVVLRLLGGSGYWRYGLDRLSALCRDRGIPLAVLSGEAQPDPNLTAYGTVPLRLLLPLNYEIRIGFKKAVLILRPTELPLVPNPHRVIRSVEATGGVYKGQGRNQGRLMTYPY